MLSSLRKVGLLGFAQQRCKVKFVGTFLTDSTAALRPSATRVIMLSLFMNTESNVTEVPSKTQAPRTGGLLFGLLGVLAYSFTMPLTRVAVAELAAALLLVTRQPLPERRHWVRLVVVGSGVIVGFPLFTSLALRELPSADAAVIVGLLPAATAVMAVLRAGERPSRAFWGACTVLCALLVLGSVAVGQRTRVKSGARGGKTAATKTGRNV